MRNEHGRSILFEFEEDFRKIDEPLALQDNVSSLQRLHRFRRPRKHQYLAAMTSISSASFRIVEETPDVLETKYPSNILVVDDNPANTEYLRRKLVAARHRVLVANSGHEAETILQGGEPVDLVLLDILMPDLSGYDILGRNRDLLQSKTFLSLWFRP